jgi:hypothetical protein
MDCCGRSRCSRGHTPTAAWRSSCRHPWQRQPAIPGHRDRLGDRGRRRRHSASAPPDPAGPGDANSAENGAADGSDRNSSSISCSSGSVTPHLPSRHAEPEHEGSAGATSEGEAGSDGSAGRQGSCRRVDQETHRTSCASPTFQAGRTSRTNGRYGSPRCHRPRWFEWKWNHWGPRRDRCDWSARRRRSHRTARRDGCDGRARRDWCDGRAGRDRCDWSAGRDG